MKNLVIVESPTKVKTIKKFLGKNYEVMASNGHVRDLPKSQLGIDCEHDFEPKYITIRGKGDLLASLRKEVKKADKIYLATDPDREGEAISWHLTKALNLEEGKYVRITFNEITKNAVKNSFKNPRDIDMNLVDAQQTRRILDRIVGYRISPVLWVKVKRGLSAGRVQSSTLNIICDRETEINDFIPQEYYTLDATLKNGRKSFPVAFYGTKNKKLEISDKESLEKILKEIGNSDFVVDDMKTSKRVRKSPLPFTTSTMQQEASKALNFSIQKTMQVAQQLYEGVNVKGSGTVGLITYLRTDSIRISDEAKALAKEYITEKYGANYYKEYKPAVKGKKGNIQDAHEAIRPSDIHNVPSEIADSLTKDQLKLYSLIYYRFLASQMQDCEYDVLSVRFAAKDYIFTQSESKKAFDGFTAIYEEADEKDVDPKYALSTLKVKDVLPCEELTEKQHFTQAPARFTEASLVHTLEELGIGRPSTYSPIITTLLKRRYITKEGRQIYVTELGEIVNDIMKKSFPSIVNQNFTANLESLLDGVEDGSVEWKSVVRNFYPDLDEQVRLAEKELEKVKIEPEVTDVICEKCGRNMIVKYGPKGKFLGCPGYPECVNAKPYLKKIGVNCPECGKELVERRSKKGRKFFGCEGYPDCDFSSWQMPVTKKCPKCGSYMVRKGNKIMCSADTCGYSESSKNED